LNDAGEKGDAAAGDLTYTLELPKEEVKYYFIVAEGEKTATVFPAKGSFEMTEVQ